MAQKNFTHSEWKVDNSLTAPEDRRSKYLPNNRRAPKLTNDQLQSAAEELIVDDFVERFPRLERRFADPEIVSQRIGLISFVPAKGARPNDNGVYGFAKLRGNYATEQEAQERAVELLEDDSYHKIYHAFVGRPFPLTQSSKFSAKIDEVDLKKQIRESFNEDVRKKRQKEQKEIEEIQEREKMLLSESKQESENPDDSYTTLRVKKAQISWTYLETQKKLAEMEKIIIKTDQQIREMDQKDSSLAKQYFDKYIKAREEAGLKNDKDAFKNTFMRFLVEDADLPFLPKKENQTNDETMVLKPIIEESESQTSPDTPNTHSKTENTGQSKSK